MEDFTYKNTKYRSAVVVNGMSMAGPRAHFRGMGLSNEELRKPFIGIINTHNEMHPGHVHLDKLAEPFPRPVQADRGFRWYSV